MTAGKDRHQSPPHRPINLTIERTFRCRLRWGFYIGGGMNLREQGYRFYVSPDKQRVKWLQPAMRDHMYPDWVDATDWPDDDFVAHLEAA